jgi:hypothetical protein
MIQEYPQELGAGVMRLEVDQIGLNRGDGRVFRGVGWMGSIWK